MKHQDNDPFVDEIEDKIYNSAKFLAENEVPKGYITKHKSKISTSLKVQRFLVRYVPVTLVHVIFAIGALVASNALSYDKETGLINGAFMMLLSILFLMLSQFISSMITYAYLTMISKLEIQK